MSHENDLDILANEVEVEASLGSRPRFGQVLGGLIGVGLLVGLLGVVIAFGLSLLTASGGPDETCAAPCSQLSLTQVRSLTGIALPDDSDVIESTYARTTGLITVTARVVLPDGSDNPFDETAYQRISQPTEPWTTDDLTVQGYYAATGEQGTLKAEAVYAIDDDSIETVFVVVRRDLS